MMQASYVKFHPTSGYHRATTEMNGSTTGSRSTTSTTDTIHNDQWTPISYHCAPKFFDAMKEEKLTNLRALGMEDEQIQAHEEILKKEKIMELYI
eukprot:1361390-Amphidinium_carterae.1